MVAAVLPARGLFCVGMHWNLRFVLEIKMIRAKPLYLEAFLIRKQAYITSVAGGRRCAVRGMCIFF